MKSTRQKFIDRKFILRDKDIRERIISAINCAPIDTERPLQVLISEQKISRKNDQNALMWAGPLRDISEQVWVDGKRYSAEIWHEHFKKIFLPEEYEEDICMPNYKKYDYGPTGDQIMIGSTTDLTVKGFSEYIENIYAFGANLGVVFRININLN